MSDEGGGAAGDAVGGSWSGTRTDPDDATAASMTASRSNVGAGNGTVGGSGWTLPGDASY